MQSLSEKALNGSFFGPDKIKNHTNEGKGKEKKQERGGRKEEKRKSNGCALSFIMDTLKKLLEAKRPFQGNVLKNPARMFWEISNFVDKWPETTSFAT